MQAIWDDLFFSIYKYLGFGIVFAVFFLLSWPLIEEKGIKNIAIYVLTELKNSKKSRNKFAFAVVFFMILSRTLICREIWKSPWANPIGEWWIYTKDGSFNTEGLENILLFIPLSFLFFSLVDKKNIVIKSVKYSFAFSIIIELCQLFGRLGTFQLSDIAQNTIGGFVGGIIYCLILKTKKCNEHY